MPGILWTSSKEQASGEFKILFLFHLLFSPSLKASPSPWYYLGGGLVYIYCMLYQGLHYTTTYQDGRQSVLYPDRDYLQMSARIQQPILYHTFPLVLVQLGCHIGIQIFLIDAHGLFCNAASRNRAVGNAPVNGLFAYAEPIRSFSDCDVLHGNSPSI